DLASIRAPDIDGNIFLVAETAGGGVEARQRRSLGKDVMWSGLSSPPARRSESPPHIGPLEPLGERAAPFPEVLRLRDGIGRRRFRRPAGALVVQMAAARGRDVRDVAAHAAEEIVLLEVQRKALVKA